MISILYFLIEQESELAFIYSLSLADILINGYIIYVDLLSRTVLVTLYKTLYENEIIADIRLSYSLNVDNGTE